MSGYVWICPVCRDMHRAEIVECTSDAAGHLPPLRDSDSHEVGHVKRPEGLPCTPEDKLSIDCQSWVVIECYGATLKAAF